MIAVMITVIAGANCFGELLISTKGKLETFDSGP
jgi:hypothetical protein